MPSPPRAITQSWFHAKTGLAIGASAFIQALVVLMLGVLCVRLYVLQVVRGERYAEIAENQRRRRLPIPAPRGVIFDRYGRPIVNSRPIYNVIMSREDVRGKDLHSLIEPLADACTRAGMPAAAVPDARPGQWRKVIFNAASNPIGALTGLTHGRVCERPDLRALVSGLVAEGKAVADAQGITLDADPEELIDHAARPDVAYDHKASMLQDVEARRATEIDYLNGGIARFGRELGVPTPLHDAISALIKGVEASWQQ